MSLFLICVICKCCQINNNINNDDIINKIDPNIGIQYFVWSYMLNTKQNEGFLNFRAREKESKSIA